MSQSDLGRLVGLTFQQIQKYENGHNRMGAALLNDVCSALQVSVMYFYGDLPEEQKRGGAQSSPMLPAGACVVSRAAIDAIRQAVDRLDHVAHDPCGESR